MKEYENVVYQLKESISLNCQNLDKKEVAYSWIQASDSPIKYHQWVNLDLSPPPLLDSIASQEYFEWLEEVEDFKYRHNIIPMPRDGDSITEYFLKLSSDCLYHEKDTQWRRSLQNFVNYLRKKKLLFDETGYLNTYFPKQMEVRYGQLIKTVENANFPIDVCAHSKIILKLINKVIKGPKQGRRGHAELLGFILTALSLSWYRFTTAVEMILNLSTEDLEVQNDPSSNRFHTVNIPTDFGEFKVPISPFHSGLLLKLAEDNDGLMIFSRNRNQMSKLLRRVLDELSEINSLGPIWLTTFLQRPHEVIDHRYQLSK